MTVLLSGHIFLPAVEVITGLNLQQIIRNLMPSMH